MSEGTIGGSLTPDDEEPTKTLDEAYAEGRKDEAEEYKHMGSLFQHDETGRMTFVAPEDEAHFKEHNKRWAYVSRCYERREHEGHSVMWQALSVHDVLAERQRQVEAEGYTPEHDDEHGPYELIDAAVCYALGSATFRWPWSPDSWKPKDQRRNLVRAAALLLARIDQLDRTRGEGWTR